MEKHNNKKPTKNNSIAAQIKNLKLKYGGSILKFIIKTKTEVKISPLLISVKNLKLKYGGSIVSPHSFDINEGDTVLLKGKNGSGKSTLIKTILGSLKPLNGTITFNPILNPVFKNIDIVQQLGTFPQFFLAKDIIELFCKIHGIDYKQTISHPVFTQLEINKFIHNKAEKMSGGEIKKLQIFLALFHTPKIIFFDEPLFGVAREDLSTIYKIIDSISKKHNITTIWVSHDRDLLEHIQSNKNLKVIELIKEDNVLPTLKTTNP